jgi:hypothetical protein
VLAGSAGVFGVSRTHDLWHRSRRAAGGATILPQIDLSIYPGTPILPVLQDRRIELTVSLAEESVPRIRRCLRRPRSSSSIKFLTATSSSARCRAWHPDRIIIGEGRGGEAYDLLEA